MDGNAPTEFQRLELRALRVWPGNPRRTMDGPKLDELASSIREKGICVPLLVRPLVPANGDVTHEVLAGQRRLRAATMVLDAAALVPCVVRSVDDAEALELGLLENAARTDADAIEEAEAIEQLVGLGRSVEQVAYRLGHSPVWVEKRRRLLGLCEEARAWVRKREVPLAHAQALATVGVELQREIVATYDEDLDVPSSRVFLQTLRGRLQLLDRAPFDLSDAKLPGGSCAKCPKRSDHQIDLFGGADERAACLDRGCWQGKVAAVWEAAERSAKKRRLAVISDPREVFAWGASVKLSAPYVCAHELPEGASLAPTAIARTEGGVVVELYDRAAVESLRAASRASSGTGDADADDADDADDVAGAAPPKGPSKFEQARAARETLIRDQLARLAARAETPSGALALFAALREDNLRSSQPRIEPALKALGVEDGAVSFERIAAVLLLALASEELEERAYLTGAEDRAETAAWLDRACGEVPLPALPPVRRKLALPQGEWLKHRKGVLDAKGLVLHRQWAIQGTQRVAELDPGAELDAILAYAAEHDLALEVTDAPF